LGSNLSLAETQPARNSRAASQQVEKVLGVRDIAMI
jgi:hypothetical protein